MLENLSDTIFNILLYILCDEGPELDKSRFQTAPATRVFATVAKSFKKALVSFDRDRCRRE